MIGCTLSSFLFFFNDTATTEIYTLSLHDALPISILLNYKISYAYKNINFFDEIIETTRSNVEEYGVETHFTTRINGQELISYFNRGIINNYNGHTSIFKNKENCDIKFSYGNSTKGLISIENLNSNPLVKITITEKEKCNNLEQINKWVKNIENKISEEENINYQYLKAKLPKCNLKKVNEDLIALLKSKGAKNIDSIEINNGFTTCAYRSEEHTSELQSRQYLVCR